MKIRRFYFIPFLILMLLQQMSFGQNSKEGGDKNEFVVVLDAGHGGHDPGNLGNGYLEKNIALKIVLKIGEILEKTPGIKVIYTRKDDTFVDLYVRGEIANKANADLFISVHCDSHTSDAHGAGTFVLGLHANKQNFAIAKKENSVIYLEDNYETRYAEYDINSPESIIGLTIMQEEFLDQSILLAKLMQENFSKKLHRTDRKVKQAGFIVLHQTFMPSVLVETGFLTNKAEGAYLNSKKGQSEMGAAIADAVLKYSKDIVPHTSHYTKEGTAPVVSKSNNKEAEAPATEGASGKTETSKTAAGEVVKKETSASNKIEKKEAVASNATDPPHVVFKVQILASSKNMALDPENFKGLNTLSKESYKNLYRYMYGNTDSLFQAKLLKSNADAKGYTTSYIVAYKDGVRIPIKEALRYVSE